MLLFIGIVFIFRSAVIKGLAPLNEISEKAASIDIAKIDERFSTKQLPEELQPITKRLNDLLERLETAFIRERRFTSNAAHELRTPIAELRALAEVGLGANYEKPEDLRPFFQDALDISLQMQNITEALLALSRVDSGNQPVTVELVNIAEIFNETLKKNKEKSNEQNISHSFVSVDETFVKTDKSIIAAIITNLVSNAVSYAPENSTITMEIKRENSSFLVSISNHTHNLDKTDLENIFQPFWRKDDARTDLSHCGIGLALVKSYCRILNISILAELITPDTFKVTLNIPGKYSA